MPRKKRGPFSPLIKCYLVYDIEHTLYIICASRETAELYIRLEANKDSFFIEEHIIYAKTIRR